MTHARVYRSHTLLIPRLGIDSKPSIWNLIDVIVSVCMRMAGGSGDTFLPSSAAAHGHAHVLHARLCSHGPCRTVSFIMHRVNVVVCPWMAPEGVPRPRAEGVGPRAS